MQLSCGTRASLPTAPSDLVTGIVVYEHANYQGESAHIEQDIPDLKSYKGACKHEDSNTNADGTTTSSTYYDWNDCISSIRVAPGWGATIHRDDDYKGQSLQVVSDVSNLQLVPGSCSHDGLNDCITSIRVFQR